MIDRQKLTTAVQDAIAGTDMFLVDIKITPANDITVELDSPTGMDIDTCAAVTRKIEAVFDREAEDYSLEVGSAGLTAPFKVRGQYLKNLGNEVEVLCGGKKVRGTLTEVAPEDPAAPDEIVFTVEVPTKVKEPGAKRPVTVMTPTVFKASECKSVTYLIKF